jgi:hypothetical protein
MNWVDTTSYTTMQLDGSPLADLLYVSGTNVVGSILGIRLGATLNGFTPSDVGRYVYANNGVVRLFQYVNGSNMTGVVVRRLDNVTTTPSGGWSLEDSCWTVTNGYPTACGFHGGRIWFGGTKRQATQLWGSAINDYNDFSAGTRDDSALDYRIGSDRNDAIMHIASNRSVVVFTRSAEYTVYGASGGNITPTTSTVRNETSFGSGAVAPEYLEGQVIFVQRGATKVRGMGYQYDVDRMNSPEISKLSEHLLKAGVVEMTSTHEPYISLYAVMTTGQIITCSVDVGETVAGWSRRVITNGLARSVCAVTESGSDVIYVLVYRNTGATSKLTLERFDHACYLDYQCTFTGPGTTYNVSARYGNGTSLAILADGEYIGDRTVTGGNITLDQSAGSITVGYNFTGRIIPLPPEFGMNDGAAHGKKARCGIVTLYVRDTPSISVNGEVWENRIAGTAKFDEPCPPYTGFINREFLLLGHERGGGDVIIERTAPHACTLLTITREVEVQ